MCRLKNTFLLLAGLLSFGAALCQALPEITHQDFPGAEITRNDTYDGTSLWGYMNGGADLYLEYGFLNLRVEEMKLKGEELKIECFQMSSPLSAFGIFSVRTYKCLAKDTICKIDCLNRYQ
jgi:uncharacterized protein DUF6599